MIKHLYPFFFLILIFSHIFFILLIEISRVSLSLRASTGEPDDKHRPLLIKDHS